MTTTTTSSLVDSLPPGTIACPPVPQSVDNGTTSNVRVVARIRPALSHELNLRQVIHAEEVDLDTDEDDDNERELDTDDGSVTTNDSLSSKSGLDDTHNEPDATKNKSRRSQRRLMGKEPTPLTLGQATTTTRMTKASSRMRRIVSAWNPKGIGAKHQSQIPEPSTTTPRKRISHIPVPLGGKTPPSTMALPYIGEATPVMSNTTRHSALPAKSPSRVQRPPSGAGRKRNIKLRPQPPTLTTLIAETNKPRKFTFDAVFAPEATQAEVYQASVGDTIRRNILRGYNSTIMAYGQTASGKSYTMFGREATEMESAVTQPDWDIESLRQSPRQSPRQRTSSNLVQPDDGIIPRAIADLFDAKRQHKDNSEQVYVELTCLEIYNDELRDLLAVQTGDGRPDSLKLRDTGDLDGAIVQGLQAVPIHSLPQARRLIQQAIQGRTTATTFSNERSSRSHAVATLSVSIRCTRKNKTTKAKLTLVDLAGSERIKQTGVVGLQQQESININKDLFVLGKVVSALAERTTHQNTHHVPYRDSKLTRILRDSLGGNCCTVLVACVSPVAPNAEESLNTLRYAERSKAITNSVRCNVLSERKNNYIHLQNENKRLKKMLSRYKRKLCLVQGSTSLSLSSASSSGSVTGLRQKLRIARAEAQSAREQSESIRVAAERWKEQLEALKERKTQEDESGHLLHDKFPMEGEDLKSPLLEKASSDPAQTAFNTYFDDSVFSTSDLNASGFTGSISAESCQDDPFCGVEATSTASLTTEESHASVHTSEPVKEQVEDEVRELVQQKFHLADSLADMQEIMEVKQSQIDELEEEYGARQEEICKLEVVRADLQNELDSLERRVKGVEYSSVERTTNSLRTAALNAVFRNIGPDPVNSSGEENMVEMKTLSTHVEEDAASSSNDGVMFDDKVRRENVDLNQKCLAQEEELEDLKNQNEFLQNEIRNLRNELVMVKTISSRREVSGGDSTLPTAEMARLLQQTDADLVAATESFFGQDSSQQCRNPVLGEEGNQTRAGSLFTSHESGGTSVATSFGAPDLHQCEKPKLVISNLDCISDLDDSQICTCEELPMAIKPEHVDFYLPKLSTSCTCGKRSVYLDQDRADPGALDQILRGWQVDFLASLGITTAASFVVAVKEKNLNYFARQMRRWRKRHKMLAVKTKSCETAVHIWARTCLTVLDNMVAASSSHRREQQKFLQFHPKTWNESSVRVEV